MAISYIHKCYTLNKIILNCVFTSRALKHKIGLYTMDKCNTIYVCLLKYTIKPYIKVLKFRILCFCCLYVEDEKGEEEWLLLLLKYMKTHVIFHTIFKVNNGKSYYNQPNQCESYMTLGIRIWPSTEWKIKRNWK